MSTFAPGVTAIIELLLTMERLGPLSDPEMLKKQGSTVVYMLDQYPQRHVQYFLAPQYDIDSAENSAVAVVYYLPQAIELPEVGVPTSSNLRQSVSSLRLL